MKKNGRGKAREVKSGAESTRKKKEKVSFSLPPIPAEEKIEAEQSDPAPEKENLSDEELENVLLSDEEDYLVFGGDEEAEPVEAEVDPEAEQSEEAPVVVSLPTLPISSTEAFYVPREKRLTPNVLTTFEFAECVSIRASEFARDQICYASTEHDDPKKMAVAEIQQQKCPLTLNRQVGFRDVDGVRIPVIEQWDICEMIVTEIPVHFQ